MCWQTKLDYISEHQGSYKYQMSHQQLHNTVQITFELHLNL